MLTRAYHALSRHGNAARHTATWLSRTLASVPEPAARVGLSDDQLQFKQVADDFAREKLLPFAAEWDETKHFPRDVLKVTSCCAAHAKYQTNIPLHRKQQRLGLLASMCEMMWEVLVWVDWMLPSSLRH